MFYRVEVLDCNQTWKGVFAATRDVYLLNDMSGWEWVEFLLYLPAPLLRGDFEFWFSEKGFHEFEMVADDFLLIVEMVGGEDIRILESDLAEKGIAYQDEFQVAIKKR